MRRRLALIVHLAAAAGQFSAKLSEAVGRATDAEIRIMSDLVDRGLTIPALVNVLQGAHVLVGDDSRYQAWIFPSSRPRLSSHHRNIDKRSNPDYGIDGPLVRESLHGKATIGTWVQFERTKATFRWGQLPTWDDALHLRDYVIYRLTGKNVGPWGLSANVDTRPILLRAPQRTPGRAAMRGLSVLTEARPGVAGPTADRPGGQAENVWLRTLSAEVPAVGPLGDLYRAPRIVSARRLLPDQPWSGELREGLFGSLAVLRWTTRLPPGVSALLDATTRPALLSLDDRLGTGRVELQVRGLPVLTRSVREAGGPTSSVPPPDQEPGLTPEIDPEPADASAAEAASGTASPAQRAEAGAPDLVSAPPGVEAEPGDDVADVALVPIDTSAVSDLHAQLAEFAELVRTGPVRLGAYTQAELAVVLGDAPALRGSSPEVLAEAARSLAARGVLFRDADSDQVTVVGDLGLVLALATTRIGTLEIRRGHPGDPNEAWRWLITVLPLGVVAIDRIDTLGLHRLAVHSTQGVAQYVAERLVDGSARIARDEPPIRIDTETAHELLTDGLTRWQLLLRLPEEGRTVLTIEAHVVRTSEHRVDLITRDPDGTGYTRTAVDARTLRQFLVHLFATA